MMDVLYIKISIVKQIHYVEMVHWMSEKLVETVHMMFDLAVVIEFLTHENHVPLVHWMFEIVIVAEMEK